MAKKQIRREDIDEDLILNLIGGVDTPPRITPQPTPPASPPKTSTPEVHEAAEIRETPRVKSDADTSPAKVKGDAGNRKSEFEQLFLRTRASQPQTTCRIARETGEKLNLIVRMLGGSGISLKTYVNNILDAHLEQYRDEIKNLIINAKNIKL